jgi:hypothetical protein
MVEEFMAEKLIFEKLLVEKFMFEQFIVEKFIVEALGLKSSWLKFPTTNGSIKSNVKIPGPPYKEIICSLPFWSLVLTYVCSYWGFYTLLTNVPTYLNNIQHIPLTLVSLTILGNFVYSPNQ